MRRRLFAVTLVAAVVVTVAASLASAGVASRRGDFAGGYGPVWSPDGSQIAYIGPTRNTSESGDLGLSHVYVVPAAGSAQATVVASAPSNETLNEVRWAQTGRFVFQVSELDSLRSTDPATGKVVKLGTFSLTSGMGEAFSLSNDGLSVAYTEPCRCALRLGTAVALVAAAGGKPRMMPRPVNAVDEEPSFSPNGKQVVFTRILRGKGIQARSPNESLVVEPTQGVHPHWLGVSGNWAAFSPDGRWIAFLKPAAGLEVMPASGGKQRLLVPFRYLDGDGSFSWAANSSRLAYLTPTKIGSVDLSGKTTPYAISGLRPDFLTPQWSPDGSAVAFSAIKKGADLDIRVYVINADGSGLRRIA